MGDRNDGNDSRSDSERKKYEYSLASVFCSVRGRTISWI